MSKTHILIIDGDMKSAQAMSDLLESRSYKADATHNNVDALAQINHFPDLILLDRTLPDIDGLEICKAVRSNKRLQHISIIVLSEQDVSAEKAKGLQQGADDYLIKPVDDEELIARIEAVLRRNQVFRESQGKRGALVTELKKILDEELITPYFQPIYSMDTHLPYGLEALSRPKTGGLIDNAEFLFKTALILDMYSEVEMLCWRKAVNEWKRVANREKLFLNCTPYFIESGRLNKDFLTNLNVDLNNIVLEITERTAIQNQKLFLGELNTLRGYGINIAVDDVGSGFASLDTVIEIRPDIIKIDRHLVHDLHKDELRYNIMQSVISFCKKSKMMTVAEGIEYEGELDVVSDLGVDAIQGYLVGKPTPEINPDIFTKKFDY